MKEQRFVITGISTLTGYREEISRPMGEEEARARLGIHAGLMQQFLFHAARVGAMALGD